MIIYVFMPRHVVTYIILLHNVTHISYTLSKRVYRKYIWYFPKHLKIVKHMLIVHFRICVTVDKHLPSLCSTFYSICICLPL